MSNRAHALEHIHRRVHQAGVLAIAVVLAGAATAQAGPPLLCHPFDIGSARSLPWDGSSSWFHGRAEYQLSNLVHDTEALLTADTAVIVRMETLRRAAIYASRDGAVATALMKRLDDRARGVNASGPEDPLALFDAAYVVEAFRQLMMVDRSVGRVADLAPLVAGKDGYAMLKRTLQLRANDSSLEFAAALFAASKDRATHGAAYAEHARRAKEGARSDALLARNIGQLG